MHLVNLIVQLRRKYYPPRQTSARIARSRGIKSARPMFGAELVDDFRAYTRRIDLLFAAMRVASLSPLIETIVCRSAVDPSARWLSPPPPPPPPPASQAARATRRCTRSAFRIFRHRTSVDL